MNHIITRIEQTEKGAVLYLYHPENPKTIEVTLPHVIPTTTLRPEQIKETLDGLNVDIKTTTRLQLFGTQDKYEKANSADVTTPAIINGRTIIQATGPATIKQRLFTKNKAFIVGTKQKPDARNNITRIHKIQLGWPFAIAQQIDEHTIFTHTTPTIDELLALPTTAFDTEFQGWEQAITATRLAITEEQLKDYLERQEQDVCGTRKELEERVIKHIQQTDIYRVFGIGLAVSDSRLPNFYFSTYQLPEIRTTIKTQHGQHEFENIVVADLDDLETALAQIAATLGDRAKQLYEYHEEAPPITTSAQAITHLFAITKRAINDFLTGTFNGGSYDYPNLRGELKNTHFRSGINGKPPIHEADLGFFKRHIEPGRHTIDCCLVSQKYLAGSVNNKLVTFLELLFGIKDAKDLTYEDTTKKRIEATLGNVDSSYENAVYAMKDTIHHLYAVEAIKKSVYLLCLLLQQSPEVVTSTSSNTISENILQIASLKKRGTYLPRNFGDVEVKYDDFDIEKEKNKLFATETSKGTTTADVYYVMPFVSALMPLIKRNPHAIRVLDELDGLKNNRKDRHNALILAQGLQKDYLSLVIHAALNHSPTRCQEQTPQKWTRDSHIFQQITGKTLTEVANWINDAREELLELLGDAIINSRTLTAIKQDNGLRRELEQRHHAKYLGTGQVYSLRKGIFIARIDATTYSQGIDLTYTRGGMRNELERQFAQQFLDHLFNARLDFAAQLYEQTCQALREGRVPPEELQYKTTARKNYYDYSAKANSRTIEHRRKNAVLKGQQTIWGYEPEMHLMVMFGEKGMGSYDIDDGKAKSSLGGLVETMLAFNTDDPARIKAKQKALQRIRDGEHSTEDLKLVSGI